MDSRQNQRPQRQSRPRGGRNAPRSNERQQNENSKDNQRPARQQNDKQQNQRQTYQRRPRLPNISLRRDMKDIKLNEEQQKQVEELTAQIDAYGKIEIPDISIRVKKDEELTGQIDRISSQIQTLREKIEDIQRKQDNYEKEHNPHKQESDEAYQNLKKIEEKVQPMINERNQIRAERIQLDSKKKTIEDKTPGRSIDDLRDRIEQINYQIETQSMTNAQLKAKLSEIENIKKKMSQFTEIGPINKRIDELRQRERALNEQIKTLFDQKTALREQVSGFKEGSKEIKAARDKFWTERKAVNAQIVELKKQLDAKYQERKEFNNKFFAERHELMQKRDDVALLINKRRQIYQEAERHMDLLEKGAKQAGEIKERRNPNEEKINAARSLISYLQGILALGEEKEQEEETVMHGKAQNTAALDLVSSLRKPSKKEKKAAKKSKKAEEKPKNTKLDLTLESIQQFASVSVTQPTTTEQIPDVIAQLKKKAQEWEDSFIKLVLTFNVQADGSIKSAITIA